MRITLDSVQIFFWSVTYILAIRYAFLFRKSIIPYPAILGNLAWETVALFTSGMICHIVWLSLDVIIAVQFLHYAKNGRRFKIIWIICYLILVYGLRQIFYIENGMLYSCFVIDLLMAVLFCLKFLKDRNGGGGQYLESQLLRQS